MQSRVPLGPGKFHVVVLVLYIMSMCDENITNLCASYIQPHPQGFSLKKWVGREWKWVGPPHPIFKGKALETRLSYMENIRRNRPELVQGSKQP